jgi:hypothetical protein
MTEDEDNSEPNEREETHHEEEHLQDLADQNMPDFVDALNRFVTYVSSMDWPEAFNLRENETLCFTVFRSYWRQHKRRRRENREHGHRVHMRFQGVDEEELRRFLHRTFGEMADDSESVLNIDPEDHHPEGEHNDVDSKERQRRFQDEWS